MQDIYGTRCATLLLAIGLPWERMVQCLVGDLDLTYDEAAEALLTAQSMQSRDQASATGDVLVGRSLRV